MCVCARVVHTARCVVACIDRVLCVPTNFVYARRTIHTQTRDTWRHGPRSSDGRDGENTEHRSPGGAARPRDE